MNVKNIIKYLPFYLLSVMPMSILYVCSDLTFVIVYYVLGYRKKVVLGNLEQAFPSRKKEELNKIAKDFFHHFCDLMFEWIKGLTIRPEQVKKRLIIRNPELIQKYWSDKRDILLYTAHLGNWEWLIFLPLFFPYYSNTFYRPQKNAYINGLLQLTRQRFGVHLIEEHKGYKTMVKLNQAKTQMMNCMIGDQSPSRISPKYWCTFLNRQTAFLIGADKIARKTDQVVLFPAFRKIRRGHYELEFKLIEDEPRRKNNFEIIENYARELENTIIKAPELWLWSHRRWKLNV